MVTIKLQTSLTDRFDNSPLSHVGVQNSGTHYDLYFNKDKSRLWAVRTFNVKSKTFYLLQLMDDKLPIQGHGMIIEWIENNQIHELQAIDIILD